MWLQNLYNRMKKRINIINIQMDDFLNVIKEDLQVRNKIKDIVEKILKYHIIINQNYDKIH